MSIHPTAVIDSSCEIATNVSIGAYSVIGPRVSIAEGSVLSPFVSIAGNTRIGRGNRIGSFAVLGGDPAHQEHQADDDTWLEIGDDNTIHEHVTLHRGAKVCRGLTSVGSRNHIMCYAHVAHDCQVGNNTRLVNGATLGGQVVVEDFAHLGAGSAIFQRMRIGTFAVLQAGSAIQRSILPYMYVDSKRVLTIHKIGMQRHGMSQAQISKVWDLYRLICRSKLLLSDLIAKLADDKDPLSQQMHRFIEAYQPVMR